MMPKDAYKRFSNQPVRNEKGEVTCPKCLKPLKNVFKKVLRCEEHGDFKIVRQKKPKVPDTKVDINDSSTWKARCEECGGVMDYFNLMYGCRDCGHVMEV